MSISHNKKKNTALLFEFLMQHVSKSLVTNDERGANAALKLIEKHFKSDTLLFKEYRLARALISTRGIHERIAYSIIEESKNAVKKYDLDKLNESKRKLVRDINYKLNDEIFDYAIPEFKIYATIQQLFEMWRRDDSLNESRDLEKKSKFESVLLQWLITEEKTDNEEVYSLAEYSPGVRRLIIKKMTEKLNERYAGKLNSDQRELIRLYAFNEGSEKMTNKLIEIKNNAKKLSGEFLVESKNNEFISNKLSNVISLMEKETYDNIDDEIIVRHMKYSSLIDEIKREE